MRITLRDLETGREETVEDSAIGLYEWEFGNWSCDCNRALYFGHDSGGDSCLGEVRYIVVAVDPMPEDCTLADFNVGYPTPALPEKGSSETRPHREEKK